MRSRIIMLLALIFAAYQNFSQTYDVAVYGSTSAGVTAAVQSAKMGKKVLLISSSNHIGGLTSSGLGATDINRYKAIGGMSREFYQRVYEYYSSPSAWKFNDREEYFSSITKRIFTGRNEELKMQWVFEPHVAEKIFRDMLLEAGVKVLFGERLELSGNVKKDKNRIASIKMESGIEIMAKVFIDATYEGDLMARAGVTYVVGREANEKYNEQHNGIIINEVYGRSDVSISPYRIEGDPSSGLLPYIDKGVPGVEGNGDLGVQAYCFRLTMTDDPDNMIPFSKPDDYDPLLYEALGRKLAMFPEMKLHDRNSGVPNLLTFNKMPNRKTDTNHLDFVGASVDWPEGNYETREKLYQLHKNHHLGLFWFLKTDSRVPAQMKEELDRWGLAKDEFIKYESFPPQIYVREARRMVSDYVMTEHNAIGQESVQNSIGLGTYAMDSHQISRFVAEDGKVYDEGKFFVTKGIRPYPISYKSIVPRKKECSNLLVPVCLSASHAVYGSIRMEPVYMVLGQSAGIAAVLAIDKEIDLSDLPYSDLEKCLKNYDQILQPDQIQ